MERLDIRTEDGKITGQTEDRKIVHEKGLLHGTSHVWLIKRKTNKHFEILLQKRSACKDSYPGCFDVSSAGHIPAGQNYRESAIRELKEELGITLSQEQLQFIGMRTGRKINTFYGKEFNDYEISAVYIYETNQNLKNLQLQKEEVESVMWIDFDECMQRIKRNTINCCVYPDEFQMLDQAVRGKEKRNI